MIEILISIVITLGLILLANIFDPVITAVGTIFTSFPTVFGYLLQFLRLGLTYFIFFCQLFMVPPGALVLFFSFLAVIIVFNVLLWGVGLGVAIYKFIRGGTGQ